MTKEKQSIGEQIYSGTATFGKIWAVASAIFGTIISIVMLIIGISVISHKSHLRSVPGQVMEDAECTTTDSQQQTFTTCRTKISYEVDGVTYTPTVDSGSFQYTAGTEVTVWYSPSSPERPELNPFPKWVGWMLIIFAFLICIGVWIWVWVTRKSKVAAAAGGAIELVSLIK